MAEVTALRNNALNYPVYGVPYGVSFPILDADGDPIPGAAGLDSEVSKNADTFADCTNEATEIATSSGVYYLLLTGTEMTADLVSLIVKTSSTGGKTTVLTLYPRKLPVLRSGTAQGGAAGSITLDAGASPIDDFYNGCLVVGTLDGTVEARVISDYNGSTKVASVIPDWVTVPDSDDTFVVRIPEGLQVQQAAVSHAADVAWNSGAIQANTLASATITAAKFGANAIDAAATAADFLAEIKAQVVAALDTDTYGEPTGAPPATASLTRKIGQLYMLHRNRVDVTASAFTVFDDGNAAEYSKALTDNGTTYSEAEAV